MSEGSVEAGDQVTDGVRFVARSVARHRWLALIVFVAFAAATIAALRLLPARWKVTSRIQATPSETAPGAARPSGGGPLALTEASVASALSRSWLEQTSRELHLADRVGGGETAVVDALEKKLELKLDVDAVTLELTWPDRDSAVEVLARAEQRFVAFRRNVELAPLEEREAVLAKTLENARAQFSGSLADIDRLLQSKRKGAKASTVRGLQAEGHWGQLPDPRLIELRQQILETRTQLAEQEKSHLEQTAQLEATATEQRAIYAPEHPVLRDTEEKLKLLKQRGQQLDQLRQKERALVSEYVQLGGRDGELSENEKPLWPEELTRDDEALSMSRARLSREVDRIAQLELEWTMVKAQLASERASFPERYVIISPVRAPLAPAFPDPRMFLLAAFGGGLLLAVFAAVSRDLWTDLVVEKQQIVKATGLQILAEVAQR